MFTETTPTGFFCKFLNNNGLRKNDNKVLLSGAITFDLGLSAPFEFQLDDFVILKENASSNETLATKTGTIDQDFDGIPVTIDYTLKTVGVESLPTFTTPRGEVYTDVKKVKFTISLKVVAVVTIPGSPIPFNVTLLNTQVKIQLLKQIILLLENVNQEIKTNKATTDCFTTQFL